MLCSNIDILSATGSGDPIGYLNLSTDEGVGATLMRATEEVLIDGFLTPAAVTIIKRRLALCLEAQDHHNCRLYKWMQDGKRPLRLLDLQTGDDNYCTLVDATGVEEYVTLSYRWGKALPLMTTESTLKEHYSNILVQAMPKTFRDAVEIVRALEMRYLWIDALCIVQDRLSEWQQEAKNMASIYQGALFTIVATSAIDSDGGCLFRYDTSNCAQIPYYDPARQKDGLLYIRPMRAFSFQDTINGSEWNRRGWTLQERYLSMRLLHFTHEGLYWECQRMVLAPRTTSRSYDTDESNQEFDRYLCGSHHPSLTEWFQVVENYTARKLTKPEDRIHAIAGMTADFQRRSRGSLRHVAGLWDGSDLATQLHWVVRGKTSDRTRCHGPTWSWTSVNDAVRWTLWGQYSKYSYSCGITIGNSIDPSNVELEITGRLVPVQVPVNSALSEPKSGKQPRASTVLVETSHINDSSIYHMTTIADSSGNTAGEAVFDVYPAWNPIMELVGPRTALDGPILALALGMDDPREVTGRDGKSTVVNIKVLLLARVQVSRFRRVGAGLVTEMDVFAGVPEQKFTLV